MRNDLTACDGPITATAAPIGLGGSRRRRIVRGLLALPLALALVAPGGIAVAAEATSNYKQTPAPKQETAPTKTAAKETQPTKAEAKTEPTATTAKTLPFTGLDLRWVTVGGLLLVGMGMSIVMVQRRRNGTGASR